MLQWVLVARRIAANIGQAAEAFAEAVAGGRLA
jgi:hypothetical protein